MNPDKIRNVLSIPFMILTAVAIITCSIAEDSLKVLIYACDAATFVKLMEFFIRFTNR